MDKYMNRIYADCSDKELLKEAFEVINSLYEGDKLPEDLVKYSATIASLARLLKYGATREVDNEVIKEEIKKNDKLYKELSDI